MTVDFYDAGNGDGLFDVLGKIFFAQSTINTARGTTVPAQILDILTQAENLTDDVDVTKALRGVPTATESFIAAGNGPLSTLRLVASDLLVELVKQDNPQPNETVTTALKEVIKQMLATSESVDASTVTVAIADVGSPAGDGKLIASIKRGDGLNQENMYAETIAVKMTTDVVGASLDVTVAADVSLLAHDWPTGSGVVSSLAPVAPGGDLLKNGDFEDEDDVTNAPDDWVVSVGTIGTTLLMTDVELQTIIIAGSPTSGHYLVSWQNADSKTQTTDPPVAWDATGSKLQSALRKLKGLEEITVVTTGTSPNFTHTITFTGRGGNLNQLTSTNNLAGGTAANEKQTVTFNDNPTGGVWDLTVTVGTDAQSSLGLAYDISNANLDTAITALSNITAVTITGGPLPGTAVVVEFTNPGNQDLPPMTSVSTLLTGGDAAITLSAVDGVASANAVMTVKLLGTPTGGTFTLKLGDQTIAATAYNAANSVLDTNLEALSNVQSGDITISDGPLPAETTITFAGSLAATPLPLLIANTASLTGGALSAAAATTTPGVAGGNEKQTIGANDGITGGPQSLTFTGVNNDEDVTFIFNWNDTSTLIQTSMETAGFTVGNVAVTGGPLPDNDVTVEFLADYAGQNVDILVVNKISLTGNALRNLVELSSSLVTQLIDGNATSDEIQRVWFDTQRALLATDTFTLTFGGNTTSALSPLATAAQVEAALESLASIGTGNVKVYGPTKSLSSDANLTPIDGSLWYVHFIGSLAGASQALMTIDVTDLPPLNSTAVTEYQDGGVANANETQFVFLGNVPNLDGKFRLEFEEDTTNWIAINDALPDSTTLLDELVALSSIGSGNIEVDYPLETGGEGGGFNRLRGYFMVRFISSLAATSVNLIRVDPGGFPVSVLLPGGAGGTDEIQTLTITGTPAQGSVNVTFTDPDAVADNIDIPHNATAAEAETLLRSIDSIKLFAVDVTGGPWPGTALTVTFQDRLGGINVNQFVVDDSKIQSEIVMATVGSQGRSEIQTLSRTGTPTSGDFTLSWDGQGPTVEIPWNGTSTEIFDALVGLSNIGEDDIRVTGGPVSTTDVVITFIGDLANAPQADITVANTNLDSASITITETQKGAPSGSIAHATTTGGTAEVFNGGKAVIFDSDGAELTTLNQKVALEPLTAYAVSCWVNTDSTPAAGVLTLDLVDGIGGTVINDKQAVANSMTFNANALTTSWKHLSALVSGETFFRTPAVLPDNVYFRIRISTAVSNTSSVFFDRATLKKVEELYPGGPLVAAFEGSKRFRLDDEYTVTTTNDRAGLVQEWMNRNFDMAQLGLLLPSDTAASETIPDSTVG